MTGPCMCGDLNCPSCGPAQGANPELERVLEWVEFGLLDALPECLDAAWLADYLVDRLGTASKRLVNSIDVEAREWSRNRAQRVHGNRAPTGKELAEYQSAIILEALDHIAENAVVHSVKAKQQVIDTVVRILSSDYDAWVKKFNADADENGYPHWESLGGLSDGKQ